MTLDRDLVARALPGYDIGDEIGRGGWGVVLNAVHRQLGRKVAIKQLPRAFAADADVRRRFASEARLLATLDHPHIVPIYDYVEDHGLCLLVMELLPAGTLWSRMTSTGVTAESACGIVIAACSALDHAHRRGILHRDIKPDNLLFAAGGTMKVSDFGIAKVVGGAASMGTRTGEVLGTPAYMAPEQALGREVTPATDVYALGTVLYELLAGRLPYVDDGNAIGLLYRHVHEQPMPLGDIAPSLPNELVAATMRALAIDPADRYQQAEDFGVAVAEAANATLGTRWLRRGDVTVMAGGEIGARLSGPSRIVDTAPAPRTPPSTPTTRTTPVSPEPASPVSPTRSDIEMHSPSVQPFALPLDPPVAPAQRTEAVVPAPPPGVVDGLVAAAPRPPAPPTVMEAAVVVDPAVDAPSGAGPELSALSPSELVPLADLVAAGAPLPPPLWPGPPPPGAWATAPPSAPPAATSVEAPPPLAVAPTTPPADSVPSAAVTGAASVARPRRRRRPILLAVIGLVVAGAIAVGVIVLTRSDGNGSRPVAVTAKVAMSPDPSHLVFAFEAVFVTEPASKAIGRIDPATGAVDKFATLPATPHAIAATSDALWVTTVDSMSLLRVDPHTATTSEVPVGAGVNEIAAGAGALWVTIGGAGTVLRIDPSTNSVSATIPVGASPDSVAADDDGVWVANRVAAGTVVRIDPRTNKVVATVPVGDTPDQVALGAGAVWTADRGDGTVFRIDATTNTVAAKIDVGGAPDGVFFGAGAVWVTDSGGNVLQRIDPRTNKVTDRLEVPGNPEQVAIGAGSVWVASSADDTVTRIDPGR